MPPFLGVSALSAAENDTASKAALAKETSLPRRSCICRVLPHIWCAVVQLRACAQHVSKCAAIQSAELSRKGIAAPSRALDPAWRLPGCGNAGAGRPCPGGAHRRARPLPGGEEAGTLPAAAAP